MFCFRCVSPAPQPCAGPEASRGRLQGLLGAGLGGGKPVGPQGDALCHRGGAELSAGQGEAGAGWPYPLTQPLFPNYRTNLPPSSRRTVMRESTIRSPRLKGVPSEPLTTTVTTTCLAPRALGPFTGGRGRGGRVPLREALSPSLPWIGAGLAQRLSRAGSVHSRSAQWGPSAPGHPSGIFLMSLA